MFNTVLNFFSSIAGKTGVVRNLGDIRWIENQTEKYFGAPMEQLESDAKYLKKMAGEAGKRSKAIGSIYQSLGKIEEAKIDANIAGVAALSSVQQKRFAYASKKRTLLEAAAKRGRV